MTSALKRYSFKILEYLVTEISRNLEGKNSKSIGTYRKVIRGFI